jgi:hypothetical protein
MGLICGGWARRRRLRTCGDVGGPTRSRLGIYLSGSHGCRWQAARGDNCSLSLLAGPVLGTQHQGVEPSWGPSMEWPWNWNCHSPPVLLPLDGITIISYTVHTDGHTIFMSTKVGDPVLRVFDASHGVRGVPAVTRRGLSRSRSSCVWFTAQGGPVEEASR